MKTICFYFQVHQPFRLKRYRFFDIGSDHHYFDEYANESIMRKVAEKCYLPTNQMLLDLIQEYGTRFKISFSLSGTVIDQFERYAPDVLESFKKLAKTGSVEFIAETYSHSLSALKSKEEFKSQVNAQVAKVKEHFGQVPTTFRNTELIYSDEIGEMVADLGYEAMLTEGAKHVLGWKSPNFLYYNARNPKLRILLKNFKLSDDIAFRFSNKAWESWPLTTEKYVDWLNQLPANEEVVNLFMDYETFGEHQWAETGIFDFMRALPGRVFSHSDFEFKTPSEVANALQPVAAINVPHPISWADEERDLTAWLGNDLQDEAFDKLYDLEKLVKQIDDPKLQQDWRYLQTSDHFYYMCTKFFSDGDVHMYFNPYDSPYDGFTNFMNVLSDFTKRVKNALKNSLGDILPDNEEETMLLMEQYENELARLQEHIQSLKTKSIAGTKKQAKAISGTKKQAIAIDKAKHNPKALTDNKEDEKKPAAKKSATTKKASTKKTTAKKTTRKSTRTTKGKGNTDK